MVAVAECLAYLGRDRLRRDKVGRAQREVASQRLEERRRRPGRDDDTAGADDGVADTERGGLARERRLRDERTLEDLRSSFCGGGGQPNRGAIRIDSGAVAALQPGCSGEPDNRTDRPSRHECAVDAGVAAGFLLPGKHCRLLVGLRDEQHVAWLRVTLEVEPPDERLEFQRGLAPRLPDMPCRPTPKNLIHL